MSEGFDSLDGLAIVFVGQPPSKEIASLVVAPPAVVCTTSLLSSIISVMHWPFLFVKFLVVRWCLRLS